MLIQNGMLYHFIHCPGDLHDNASAEVTAAVMRSIEQRLGFEYTQSLVYRAQTSDSRVQNMQGCHSWQNKQPDSQLKIRPRFKGQRLFPAMVVEVASHHENLHMLLCEGAMWLNKRTDVNIVFLVKIWHDEKKVELFVLQRLEDERLRSFEFVPCERTYRKDLMALPDHLVGDHYGFHVKFHRIFDDVDMEAEVEIDLNVLFAGSSVDIGNVDPIVPVSFRWLLASFFDLLEME